LGVWRVRSQPVDRRDDLVERLVDADRVVAGPERPVAGAVVVGADLLRCRDRPTEAEIQRDVAKAAADEARLDRALALGEGDVLEQRAPVVEDGERIPGRAGRPEGQPLRRGRSGRAELGRLVAHRRLVERRKLGEIRDAADLARTEEPAVVRHRARRVVGDRPHPLVRPSSHALLREERHAPLHRQAPGEDRGSG